MNFDDLVEDQAKETGQVGMSSIPDSQYFAEGGNTFPSLPQSSEILPDFDSLQSDPKTQFILDNLTKKQTPVTNTTQQEPVTHMPSNINSDSQHLGSFDDLQDDSLKYGTPGQAIKAGLEGLGQGLVGPLAPMAEKALGVEPEAILAREKAFPAAHVAGEAAGLIGPALLTGGASAFTQAGVLKGVEKGLEKLGLITGDTLASKIGVNAARAAVDNMLISGSDEVSKMVLNDPEQSTASVIANIGLSGAIGGVAGGAFGAIASKFPKGESTKASGLIQDFTSRIKEHIDNPNPVNSMTNELKGLYENLKEVPVFGEKGIKAKAIEAAMPDMNDKIAQQISDNVTKLENTLETKLASDPNKNLLGSELAKYRQALNTDDPSQLFNATQDLKKQLQEWGKYNKSIVPLAERPFRDAAQELAFGLKTGLEDTKVWGDAAKIQQGINKSFNDFLPSLQDLEKTFTKKLSDGSREFDPGKVNTYINQLGKPNAEIKQGIVRKFVDNVEKYKAAVDDAYSSVGAESPFTPTSLNTTKSTLNEKTLGSKLADFFISKGLTQAGGESMGASLGAGVGHMLGHPGIGAIVGARALGPFFSSSLPAIAKALLSRETSAQGFKAATDYVTHVALGEKLMNTAAKSVFQAGTPVLASHLQPSKEDLKKLETKVAALQTNVKPLLANDTSLDHYMPNHSDALTQSTSNAVSYLNSIRAAQEKQGPLDSKPVLSKTQEAEFNQALMIAEQPLVVLDKIKNGTINSNDIKHLANMYPGLYSKLQQKLTNQMIDHTHDGEQVPYKTRIGLSTFMAQALDSTMNQPAILAAQPMQIQGPPPMNPPKQKGSPSSPALQKLPGMYQTASQHRIQRSQTRN